MFSKYQQISFYISMLFLTTLLLIDVSEALLNLSTNSEKNPTCVSIQRQTSFCDGYLDYSCVFPFHILNNKSQHNFNLTLGSNCDQKINEIFCRKQLPECSDQQQESCNDIDLKTVREPVKPCKAFCRITTQSCLSNKHSNLSEDTRARLKAELQEICKNLPIPQPCWNGTSSLQESTTTIKMLITSTSGVGLNATNTVKAATHETATKMELLTSLPPATGFNVTNATTPATRLKRPSPSVGFWIAIGVAAAVLAVTLSVIAVVVLKKVNA